MPYYDYRQPKIIYDPRSGATEPDVEISDFTSKVLVLCLDPIGKERGAFVYEEASHFFRHTRGGAIEQVPKRKGKGLPGGGGGGNKHPGESPVEAAIREGEEELGVPAVLLRRLILTKPYYVAYADLDQHPFYVFPVMISEDIIKAGFFKRDRIVDPKITRSGKRADWFYFRRATESILAPPRRDEREALEERGHVWFYHSQLAYVLGLLLRLVKAGVIPHKQADLPAVFFRQMSPARNFSRAMVETLVEEDAANLLRERLHKIANHERLSIQAVAVLARNDQQELVEEVIEQADPDWQPKLKGIAEKILERAKGAQRQFASLGEMQAFHKELPWEFSEDDEEVVEADEEAWEEQHQPQTNGGR